jgi:hypothetical protein
MTLDDLREEISIELESMGKIVNESLLLLNDLAGTKPTIREKTAAAAFLAQFYGGVENILKRIHRYHGIPMPTGDSWHVEIFKRFCKPLFPPFEPIFEENLALDLLPFRKFRHVVYHGYGFQLDWERMEEGLQKVGDVYRQFVTSVSDYLDRLEKERF